MKTPELVVFGCLTIDNVVRADGEVLPPSCGGNGVYCSLGSNVWCDRVGLVARRGDGYPTEHLSALAALGIDVAGVTHVGGRHELNIAFAYRDDGSRTRTFSADMMAAIPPTERHRFWDVSNHPAGHEILGAFAPRVEDMPREWWLSTAIVHCTSLPAEKTRGIATELRARAGSAIRIHVDSLWDDNVGSRAPDALPIVDLIDTILPSEQDLLNAEPASTAHETARRLLSEGRRAVVLKRGSDGCRIYEPGCAKPFDLPAFPVEAVDPTGAGDAFCGGFMAGFHETGDTRTAALYGAVSASFCVEGNGIDGLANVTRAEAQRRLDWLRNHTGIQD
jgi:sugar/nucleoside kinase (ribokinase family)